jgi:superkiller protein 3
MMIPVILSILLLAPVATEDADRLFENGKWSEARAAYEKALGDETPVDDRARILDRIGLTLLYEGKLWAAESKFAASIEAKETGRARLHRGQAYFRAAIDATTDPSALGAEIRSLLNDAAREIQRAAELDPKSADVQVALGLVERYRKDVAAEVKALARALELSPGHAEAALHLAWRRERQGDREAAGKLLASVPAASRGFAHWLALGRIAAATGRQEDAAGACEAAARIAPNDWDAFAGLWNATAYRKKFHAFDQAAKRVLEKHPDAWLPHYYLGFSQLDNGSAQAAVASFEAALKSKPDLVRAMVMIAQIHREKMKDEETAIEQYGIVLKADPENERARAAISEMAFERAVNRRHEEAGRLFEMLRIADPNNPVHTMNLALSKKELGKLEEALALYEDIEERFPFEPQIPNDRGLLLMGMGRTEEAMAAFREALERDPDFLDTLQNLGSYARLRGDLEEAMKWFKKAYDRVLREGKDPSKFRRYLDLTAGELRERENG